MKKLDALEVINDLWSDDNLNVGEKVSGIAEAYYSAGLDLAKTAEYIKATPTELSALLLLSELDDEIIAKLSDVDLPKASWIMLANASDEEITEALVALEKRRKDNKKDKEQISLTEYIYNAMIEASGPTVPQKVQALPGDYLRHASAKGVEYSLLNSKESSFIKGMATKTKMTKPQMDWLISLLNKLADGGALSRESLDDDQEICDAVLDAINR